MAVIVKYVVVRNGVEKMTFTSKKEADAYDKELDIAEVLFELMQSAELDIEETTLDDLALFLARQREDAIRVLKGGRLKPVDVVKAVKEKPAPVEESAETPVESSPPPTKTTRKGRGKNAA